MTPDFAQKMFKVFHELETLTKDKTNEYYKSNYADINSVLGQIKPVLKRHGLYILQIFLFDKLCTFLADETGNTFPKFPETTEDAKQISEIHGIKIESNEPMKKGSEITFYRRYALVALFGLESKDDDGVATAKNNNYNNQNFPI